MYNTDVMNRLLYQRSLGNVYMYLHSDKLDRPLTTDIITHDRMSKLIISN